MLQKLHGAWRGEVALAVAVVEQAWRDAVELGDRAAVRWLLGVGEALEGYSCREVCEWIGIDHAAVRRAVWRRVGGL